MSNHRTDRTIDTIVGLAEGLSTKLPAARVRIRQEMQILDSMPVGSDAPKVQATAELTKVERAAERRIELQRTLNALDIRLNDVVDILNWLHAECGRNIAVREEMPRCSAAGREGAIEWSRPECWEVPAKASLCAACYQRERRWRIDHGLPTREVAA